jgi:hypothetical protein
MCVIGVSNSEFDGCAAEQADEAAEPAAGTLV